MNSKHRFKWRHFLPEVILLNVPRTAATPNCYRNKRGDDASRGVEVDHTTIYRWVQTYGPELDKRCSPHLLKTNDSWRVDETYLEVKGEWKYLYRAVDSLGNKI